VDALELLGATYVDKKRDMIGALELWKRAMDDRQDYSSIDILDLFFILILSTHILVFLVVLSGFPTSIVCVPLLSAIHGMLIPSSVN
jgi:hypothetical protein